jgi:hypothetical protein
MGLLEQDPNNFKMILSDIVAMERLVCTRYNIENKDRTVLATNMANFLGKFVLPDGISGANPDK